MIEPPIGLLLPRSAISRSLGDAGNPESWAFPLLHQEIGEATIERLMGEPDRLLCDTVVAAAGRLADRGAAMVVGAADGLLPYQDAVQEALAVPVILSSLVLLPIVEDELPPGRNAGIVTLDPTLATPEGKAAIGLNPDTPVVALDPDGPLKSALARGAGDIDPRAVEAELVAAGAALKQTAADRPLGAVLLDSPMMGPYAAGVMAEMQVRVYDIVVLASKVYREITARPPEARAEYG